MAYKWQYRISGKPKMLWEGDQGCEFGLKVGSTNSRGGERRNCEGVPPPTPYVGVWRSVMGSHSGSKKGFYFLVQFNLQITSDDSKFYTCVLKSERYGTLSPKSWGYWYPSYPVNYAYNYEDTKRSEACSDRSEGPKSKAWNAEIRLAYHSRQSSHSLTGIARCCGILTVGLLNG